MSDCLLWGILRLSNGINQNPASYKTASTWEERLLCPCTQGCPVPWAAHPPSTPLWQQHPAASPLPRAPWGRGNWWRGGGGGALVVLIRLLQPDQGWGPWHEEYSCTPAPPALLGTIATSCAYLQAHQRYINCCKLFQRALRESLFFFFFYG